MAQLTLQPEGQTKLEFSRSGRPAPLRDDKILVSWNGLMISAFAQAALVLAEPEYAERATSAAEFVLRELRASDGRLRRSFNDGRARHNAYLDDYAFLIQGLLDLYESTSDPKWIEAALALQLQLDEHYWDSASGGYFTTSNDHEKLLARDKPSYDGAEPSGNSVALLNLLRLSELTSRDDFRTRAERGLSAFSGQLLQAPTASPKLLCALDFHLDKPREVLIVAPEGGGDTEPLVARFRRTFLPNRVFTVTPEGAELERRARLVPLLEGKQALRGEVTAFVCERGRCELPTSDPEVFARQLVGRTGTDHPMSAK